MTTFTYQEIREAFQDSIRSHGANGNLAAKVDEIYNTAAGRLIETFGARKVLHEGGKVLADLERWHREASTERRTWQQEMKRRQQEAVK